MELYIIDRIFLPSMLPEENTFMDYNLKRGIVKKVALTEEDIDRYEVKFDEATKRTTWNPETDRNNPIIVEFNDNELRYLKAACEKLSENPAPDNMWATVEKIYSACKKIS